MTTAHAEHRPESRRFRDLAVAAILLGLSVYSIVLGVQLDNQRDCLQRYIETSSDTSAVRSAQVEAESEAQRRVILGVFSGKITTKGQFADLGAAYRAALAEIDAKREANPVERFDPKRCR